MSGKQEKNAESKKLDSNGDEIVWEMETRKNVFFLLWSWIAKLGAMAFLYIFYFYISTSCQME